jgi:hypothetical protein
MSEFKVQCAVADHLSKRGASGAVWWHTPNGGERNRLDAALFKRQGVKAGIPDILVFYRSKLYALELKADSGVVSDNQKEMLSALAREGAETGVAYGLNEALAWLEQRGLLRSAFDVSIQARLGP